MIAWRSSSPQSRDRVRVQVARVGLQRTIEKLELLRLAELDRLETGVDTIGVRAELRIAGQHLNNADAMLEQIGKRL